MKKKLIIISVITFILAPVSVPAQDGAAIMADVVIGRPLGLAATALGSAIFVISLPCALMTKGVDDSARALVATPARATFKRPLGDFESLRSY